MVGSLGDKLLIGVRKPDEEIRSDSSFTTVEKKDFPLITATVEQEDMPEATL